MRSDRSVVLLASAALVGVVLAGSVAGARSGEARPAAQDLAYAPQTSSGRVSVTAAPRWKPGQLIFALAVNTHSGDLSTIDLSKALRLRVAGRVLAPNRVGSIAGHHARAEAAFALPSRPTTFRLEMRGIPDVPVRTLIWPGVASRSP